MTTQCPQCGGTGRVALVQVTDLGTAASGGALNSASCPTCADRCGGTPGRPNVKMALNTKVTGGVHRVWHKRTIYCASPGSEEWRCNECPGCLDCKSACAQGRPTELLGDWLYHVDDQRPTIEGVIGIRCMGARCTAARTPHCPHGQPLHIVSSARDPNDRGSTNYYAHPDGTACDPAPLDTQPIKDAGGDDALSTAIREAQSIPADLHEAAMRAADDMPSGYRLTRDQKASIIERAMEPVVAQIGLRAAIAAEATNTQEMYDNRARLLERAYKAEGALAERDATIEALSAKVESLTPHGSCGCSYDRPGDLCLHHAPQLVKRDAEIARLREALGRIAPEECPDNSYGGVAHCLYCNVDLLWQDAKEIHTADCAWRKARAALAPKERSMKASYAVIEADSAEELKKAVHYAFGAQFELHGPLQVIPYPPAVVVQFDETAQQGRVVKGFSLGGFRYIQAMVKYG